MKSPDAGSNKEPSLGGEESMWVGAAEERSQCEIFSRWDRVSWSASEISPR